MPGRERCDSKSESSQAISSWLADRHGASNAWCHTSTNQVCFAPIRRDSDAGCYGCKHERCISYSRIGRFNKPHFAGTIEYYLSGCWLGVLHQLGKYVCGCGVDVFFFSIELFVFLFWRSSFSKSIFSSFAKAVPGPMSIKKAKESYIPYLPRYHLQVQLGGLAKSR